jgi:hypothetical protein
MISKNTVNLIGRPDVRSAEYSNMNASSRNLCGHRSYGLLAYRMHVI